jgi:hypothetical protein
MADEPYEAQQEPPEKLEAAALAYAWVSHLAEVAEHAKAQLALHVPEGDQERALAKVRSNVGAHVHGMTYGAPPQVSGPPPGYDPKADD